MNEETIINYIGNQEEIIETAKQLKEKHKEVFEVRMKDCKNCKREYDNSCPFIELESIIDDTDCRAFVELKKDKVK